MRDPLDLFDQPILREEDDQGRTRQWTPMLGHFVIMMTIVLVGVLLAGSQGSTGLVGLSLIILVVALVVGGSVGFLFGIPRVAAQLQAEAIAAEAVAGVASKSSPEDASPSRIDALRRRRRLLHTNNNLEKVSDWLTTMLVGVGLTQLGNLDDALESFRAFLSRGAGTYAAGLLPTIGPMILVAGVAIGFMYFYVFTRVVIAPKFYDIEVGFDRDVGSERVRAEEAVQTVKTEARDLPADTPATRNIAASKAPSVEDAVSVMYDALYETGGYRNAIRIADALRSTDAENRPDYWFYLSAAHGQQYATVASDDERAAARAAALRAARRAVELSPSYRSRLWQISEPEGYDRDLAPFRDDPEFRVIVDRVTA